MSRPPARLMGIGAGLAVAALLASGCAKSDTGTKTASGVKLVTKGKLTTCTHLPYPPFQFQQGEKVVGFDVDMIDLVAKKLGVTQTVVDMPFENIQTGIALNGGKCDIAAAGMTITGERKKHIDFSSPYFNATQALMAKKGVSLPNGIADVKSQHLRLGSQASTTGEAYAQDHKADPRSYKDSAALLNGLRGGQVDAVILDYPVIQGWLKDKQNAKYTVAGQIDTGEQYGFAVKKGGNPELLKTVDQVIASAKKDGTYKKLYNKWIGPMPKSAG
ncbi:MAG TPA: ABC transporter substrate-binding protein [Streptosporangiaceae bacterium]